MYIPICLPGDMEPGELMWVPVDTDEARGDLDRLDHDERCDIPDCPRGDDCPLLPCGCRKPGYACPCGCRTVIICPSKELCRERIAALTGAEETKAVRAWMGLGLCICSFVVRNRCRCMGSVSDYQFWKASGNWSCSRRKRLVRCPCGAYFDNDTVRSLGLYSESEWRRMGYEKFQPGETYYLDPAVARWKCRWRVFVMPDGSRPPMTHRRDGPKPVARIWRPFYDRRRRRFEAGLGSVDLFSADQIDMAKWVPTTEQALRHLEDEIRRQGLTVPKFAVGQRVVFADRTPGGWHMPIPATVVGYAADGKVVVRVGEEPRLGRRACEFQVPEDRVFATDGEFTTYARGVDPKEE